MKRSTVFARHRLTVAAMALLPILGAAGPAMAGDWRIGLGTFRIGIVGAGESAVVPGAAMLRSLYARGLGVPVDIFAARDYGALVTALREGRLDYAVLSTGAYAAAWAGCGCVRPLVAPVNADGAGALRSVLLARAGAAASLASVGTMRTALGPSDSIGARLLPLAALGRSGVATDPAVLVEAPSQSEAEAMLAEGKVDALFGWALHDPGAPAGASGGSLERLERHGRRGAGFEVVWLSQPWRFGPHVVRADLAEGAVERLVAMLTALRQNDPDAYALLDRHHGGGFQPVGHDDYAAVVEALEALRDGGERGRAP